MASCSCSEGLGLIEKQMDNSYKLIANPDVAGIGVLVGLMIPAVAVFFLLFTYYLFAVDLDNTVLCTRVDRSILRRVRGILPKRSVDREAIEKIIISFSDTQLVNAFSLLISGYGLGCSISQYHWQILVQCVWFASATHLATLPVLKEYLRQNRPLVWIRSFFMTAVLAMLIALLVPTGHTNWLYTEPALPALCFFDYSFFSDSSMSFSAVWLAWSIGLIASAYIRRLAEILLASSKTLSFWERLRTHHLARFDRNVTQFSHRNWLTRFLWFVIQDTLRTSYRLFESFLWHLFWLFITIAWNTNLLVYNKWYFSKTADDNVWSFGQSMPLVLLLLPSLTITEIIIEQRRKQKPIKDTAMRVTNTFDDSSEPEHSGRIIGFILFEAFVLFLLMVGLNLVSNIPEAGSEIGPAFVGRFIVCLLCAPLVFSFCIHLVDIAWINKMFVSPQSHVRMMMKILVSIIIGLGLGVILSYYLVWTYIKAFSDFEDSFKGARIFGSAIK